MANIIKIKRSQVTATPISLSEGELAYSEASGTLFIGTSEANVTAIGGTGALSNTFSTFSVATQSDVVADASDDTLTFVAGTSISITTDVGADSITINNSAPNVSTDLSLGTITATTVDVNSSDGSNVTLPAANTTQAGLMSDVQFDKLGFISVTGAIDLDALGTSNHGEVTINATPNGLSIDGSQVLTLALSSTSTIGALSDTDWDTFNNKTSNTGTVTSVSAGNGLDFTDITGSGSVVMGTPGDLTASTTSAVTASSHTHAVSGFILSTWVDTDVTLSADSDSKIPTQKAVKAYADQLIDAANGTVYLGTIDASTNPNYPAADAGHMYVISVAGKIGGASGEAVEVGDMILCLTDSTAAGDQATVGGDWNIVQQNIDGAVIGPASVTDSNVVLFDGTTGKLIKDSGVALTGTNTGDITLGNTNYLSLTNQVLTGGTIPVASGGTNITSYTTGDILYSGGATTLSKLADIATGNALLSGGVGVAPAYGKIGLSTHVTGTLPVANGGTNITSYTIGDIVFASGATALSSLSAVATGNALISAGTGTAPSYGKIGLTTHVSGTLAVGNGGTGVTTFTSNGILYGNTTSAVQVTAAGTWDGTHSIGQILSVNASNVPTWTNTIDGGEF